MCLEMKREISVTTSPIMILETVHHATILYIYIYFCYIHKNFITISDRSGTQLLFIIPDWPKIQISGA